MTKYEIYTFHICTAEVNFSRTITLYHSTANILGFKKKSIPPGGGLSVVLTIDIGLPVVQSQGLERFFFLLWPFSVTCYLSLGFS